MKIFLLSDAWEDAWTSSELLPGHHVRRRWLVAVGIVIFWALIGLLLEVVSHFV